MRKVGHPKSFLAARARREAATKPVRHHEQPHGRREITANMPMPTGRRQSKIPMGLIETLRFALRDTAAILPPLAAATLRAAGNPRRKRQF